MIDAITSLLAMLNTLSPLAVIGLLGLVIFLLVKNRDQIGGVDGKVDLVTNNHLHGVADQLDDIAETLRRIEISNSENFAYLRARLNGVYK